MTIHGLQIAGAIFPGSRQSFLVTWSTRPATQGNTEMYHRDWCSVSPCTSQGGILAHDDALEFAPIFETHGGYSPGIADWQDFRGRTVLASRANSQAFPSAMLTYMSTPTSTKPLWCFQRATALAPKFNGPAFAIFTQAIR